MTDEAVKWAVPAITLGYSVCNDKNGKFIFTNNDVEILYRCDEWCARDLVYTDPDRHYPDLRTALEKES